MTYVSFRPRFVQHNSYKWGPWTKNVVGQWKENFEELLNLTDMSSIEEVELEGLG